MAYMRFKKSRYLSSKRFAKRRRYAPKYASAISAPIAKSPELKMVDHPSTGVAVTTAGVTTLLNQVGAGAEVYERVGRALTMKSLELKAYFVSTGAASQLDAIRCAVVYDRSPDGVTPTFADVFTSTDLVGATTSDSFAFPNIGQTERFKILADIHIPAAQTNATPNGVALANQDQNLKWWIHRYIPLNNLETKYVAASSQPNTGGLYLMFKGIFAAASQPFDAVFTARLSYIDV